MNTELSMLIRYAAIIYFTYNVGADHPLFTTYVDMSLAAATVLWAMWDRWLPFLKSKITEEEAK